MLIWLEIDTLDIYKFIKPILNKDLRDLSGGQSKMVQIIASICKIYILNSPIIILDEPTNNLDSCKVDILNQFISRLIKKNIKIFMITHDDRLLDREYNIIEL